MAAVVLAAGEGRRMGSRPKCLLQRDGQSLLARLLHALQQLPADPIVAVTGHHAALVQAELQRKSPPVLIEHNHAPEGGTAASLRVGLQALSRQGALDPGRLDAVMVLVTDLPELGPTLLRRAWSRWQARPASCQAMWPENDARPGHPKVFDVTVAQALLQSEPPQSLRDWLRHHPGRGQGWPCADPACVQDLDTEDDLSRHAQRHGQRLRWPAGV